jgi:hypothetical protein
MALRLANVKAAFRLNAVTNIAGIGGDTQVGPAGAVDFIEDVTSSIHDKDKWTLIGAFVAPVALFQDGIKLYDCISAR